MPVYRRSAGAQVVATTHYGLPAEPKTGRWYVYPNSGTVTAMTVNTAGIYAVPFQVPRTPPVKPTAGFSVSTLGTSGWTLRAALYVCDLSGEPNRLVTDLGSLIITATGAFYLPIPLPLEAGAYAVGVIGEGTPGSAAFRAMAGANSNMVPAFTTPTTANFGGVYYHAATLDGGVFPDPFVPTVPPGILSPRLILRVA